MLDSELRQRQHYDEIGDAYDLHYSDEWSSRYRVRYINRPLTAGIDLRGADALDAMCGSGQAAAWLAQQGAQVTGVDVSPVVIEQFRQRVPAARGIAASILDSGLPDASFDVVLAVGGLHHLHPHVDAAIDELHRLLRPGGHLCFAEPHAGSLMDFLRRRWYDVDPLFEENEKGVDVPALLRRNRERFDVEMTRYSGGPAYLLVYNSMVFRVPHALKRLYSPALLGLEGWVEKLQGSWNSCMVLGRWRKRA